MAIDGDATSVEEQLSPGHSQPVWDFSRLHGFQFVGARDDAAAEDASTDAERRNALILELDARAARFRQAVDGSIVLASDGTIRWLGDSVARLATGSDLLAPRTILLVDEAMSEDAQRLVGARLELWLNATIHRLLGPLFSLRGLQEGSQQLRDLAAKVANALGVLEREPIRGIVRGLDQTSRAILRRQGVRFGSYYLYVPSVLKPASRALALQLWGLQNGDEELNAATQALIPMASSGRTSAPPDDRVNSKMYRVAGFRLCGDRVVRVDIVERLADMIRAASTLRVVQASDSSPSAFLVSGQMTSLTGCSGEGFSSILRALGFESLTVARSQIVWPAAPAPATEVRGPDLLAPEAKSEDDIEAAASPLSPETLSAAESEVDLSPSDPSSLDISDAPTETDANAPEPSDSTIDPPGAPSGEPTTVQVSPESAVEAASDPSLVPVENETITIWRFVRTPAPSRPRTARQPRRKPSTPGDSRIQSDGASETASGMTSGVERPGDSHARKDGRGADFEKAPRGGKRKTWSGSKMRRTPDEKETKDGRPAASGRPTGEKKPAIDPMSPFAKLMELRSILESEGKKRT